MQYIEEIEEGTGHTVEGLYSLFGIEVTDPVADEVALVISDELFSTYDVPYDLSLLVEDINYIIREEIY